MISAGVPHQTPLGSLQRSQQKLRGLLLRERGGKRRDGEGRGEIRKGEGEGGKGEGRRNLDPNCFCLASFLAQATNECPKQLKVCGEAWGRHSERSQ